MYIFAKFIILALNLQKLFDVFVKRFDILGQNQQQGPLIVPLPSNQGQQRPQVYPVSLNQGQNQNQSPLIVPLPSSQGQQSPQVYPVSLNQGQNQNQSPLIVPLPSSGGQQRPEVYPVSLNQGPYTLLTFYLRSFALQTLANFLSLMLFLLQY